MFTFKTKEEYLTYRSEWKKNYASLSQSIRIQRLFDKECGRNWNRALLLGFQVNGTYYDKIIATYKFQNEFATEPKSELYLKLKSYIDSSKFIKHTNDTAFNMLEELKMAKLESQRQYLEQKILVI